MPKKSMIYTYLIAILFISPSLMADEIGVREVRTSQSSTMRERIDALEKEIRELKENKVAPKERVRSKFPVDLYGFVAAQTFWGDSETQLYTNQTFSYIAQSAAADETIVTKNDAWIGFTPQNSRVGLNWTGSKVGKNVTLGGKLEIDFLNPGGGMSPRPRIRLFYLNLKRDNWQLRAGQDWDLFSPLNTRSLSLGSNLWFQGNLGFRRPQIRFTYEFPLDAINSLVFAAAVNNPSNLDTLVNSGNTTSVPYFDGLIQYSREMKYGSLTLSATGIYGKKRNNNSWDNVWGLAASLNIPFHKYLQVSGEFQYGENLGDFLTYAGTTRNIKSIDAWAQISSRWHKMFETNIGYGIDNLEKSKVTSGNANVNTMVSGIYRNQNVFANFKFYPIDSFYWGIEYNYLRTDYRGNGDSVANVIMSNLVYSF